MLPISEVPCISVSYERGTPILQVSSVSGMSEEEMEVEMKERGMKVGKNAARNREVPSSTLESS